MKRSGVNHTFCAVEVEVSHLNGFGRDFDELVVETAAGFLVVGSAEAICELSSWRAAAVSVQLVCALM